VSHYVYPDTLDRGDEWLEHAVCKADPDAMHPDNNEADIAYAKSICGFCPVQLACLRDAIRTGDDQFGIRGGLRPDERRQVAKRLDRSRLGDDAALKAAVQEVLHPVAGARTLRDVWEERSHVLPDGHLGWGGGALNTAVVFQGRAYTAKQIAYIVDRGREPKGAVRRTCEVKGCVHPRHLGDLGDRHRAKASAG
jgi:hypothetical protein